MLTEKGLSHSRGLITKGVEGLKKELTFKVRSPSNELEGLPLMCLEWDILVETLTFLPDS